MWIKARCFTTLALVALIFTFFPFTIARAELSVAEPFRDYYARYQGIRVLGNPLTGLTEQNGYPAQYFEKGRIEDHRFDVTNPGWAFMYGRLTAELFEHGQQGPVNSTVLTYADLARWHSIEYRHPAPPNFTGGTLSMANGMFVPYDPLLRNAPGYIVAPYFWTYINRTDLFPGGWLHDIGLPMTDAFTTEALKNGELHTIVMQAFERSVLTYDQDNPAGWQVERGNIGADALQTAPASNPITIPAAGAQVTLPVHILARIGQPGQPVTAKLRWSNGTELSNTFMALRGEDGQGLLIANLDWINMLDPPQPATQAATLELWDPGRDLLAYQPLTVLNLADSNVQAIQVYWTISGTDSVGPQVRYVPKTARIGTASLEELLWGPPTISQIGYQTAIPTPEQVLAFPGRAPDWGPRVTLRKLTVSDGIAVADFSQELRAYGGGSLRVQLIREQITRTLLQFSSVQEVRIAIEGQIEGVLEP